MKERAKQYWAKFPRFGAEMIEVEAIKGKKVMIPKKLSDYWETAKEEVDYILSTGQDPLDCLNHPSTSPVMISLVKMYLEIF